MVKNIPGFADEQARVIAGTVDGPACDCVVGGYFPNGQAPGSDKFDYKMSWLDGAARLGARRTGARIRGWC